MYRKILVLGLSLLMLTGIAMANDLVLLDSASPAIRGPVPSTGLDETDEIFYLKRYTSSAEYYLGSGDLGDTMCVVFQPLAACSIYFAQEQFYAGGNYQSFVWEYSDAAASAYPDGRSPDRATATASPLGSILFGPYNNSAEGSQAFEDMFTDADLPGGGIWIDDGRKFVVGFVKTAEGGTPQPLADDVSARRFTYTWFGGPWTDNAWGAYSSDIAGGTVVDMEMRVGVTYPLGAPPIIGSMNQLPNTINGTKECTVNCEIVDDNGWTTDTAMLEVSFDGADPTEYEMTDDNGDNIFNASFTLDGAVSNVAYWIVATDDEGSVNSNVDEQLSFDVVTLDNPDAPILVVAENLVNSDYVDRSACFYDFLDAHSMNAQWWWVEDNKGIDEYTVNRDWDAVFVFAWGTSTVPTRAYGDDAYSAYLEGGGNFFYSDMDYFYANEGDDAEPTFSAGDFAYDFLGIQSGTNDPQPTDSTFYGMDGDPLTGDFVDNPFVTIPNRWSGDWADGVTGVASATDIFVGSDVGSINGISYEDGNGGKTVYLGFDVLSAADSVNVDEYGDIIVSGTDQFNTFMMNVADYFGLTTSAPEPVSEVPRSYSLSQNYPNPFNPTTQISFQVPQAGNVAVKIYNLAGQEVATLFNGNVNPGQKTLTFDASNLASGVYIYRMEANNFSASRKMLLIK